MASHRSFTVPTDEAMKAEGPSFDLGTETFRCVPIAPAGLLAEMVAAVSTDRQGNQVFNSVDLNRFVIGVLATRVWQPDDVIADAITTESPGTEYDEPAKPTGRWRDVDDVSRFSKRMFDGLHPVEVQTLAEIVIWLVNEYTGRPTQAPAR